MRRTEIVSTHVDDPPLRPRLTKAFQRRTNLHLRTPVRLVRSCTRVCLAFLVCAVRVAAILLSHLVRRRGALERAARLNANDATTSLAAEPLHRQAFQWTLALAQFAGSTGPSPTHSAMPCTKRQMTTNPDQQAAPLTACKSCIIKSFLTSHVWTRACHGVVGPLGNRRE